MDGWLTNYGQAELEAEFPNWLIARGTNGRWYAGKEDSSLLVEDSAEELRDAINGWIGRFEA